MSDRPEYIEDVLVEMNFQREQGKRVVTLSDASALALFDYIQSVEADRDKLVNDKSGDLMLVAKVTSLDDSFAWIALGAPEELDRYISDYFDVCSIPPDEPLVIEFDLMRKAEFDALPRDY